MMISEEKADELFQEAREFFSFPPCVIGFVDGMGPAPFFIKNGEVSVNLEATKGLRVEDIKNILLHELGHFCIYPKYYRTAVKCFEALEKGVGDELSKEWDLGVIRIGEIAHELHLLLADVVVNRQLHEWGVGIAETHRNVLANLKIDAKFTNHPLRQLFYAMENYSHGVDYHPVTYKKATEYGELIVDELMRLRPQEARFEEAGRIAACFLKEVEGESYEQPSSGEGDGDGEEGKGEGGGEGSDKNQGSHGKGEGQDKGKEKGQNKQGKGDDSSKTKTVKASYEDLKEVVEELSNLLREAHDIPTQDLDGDEEAQDGALQELTIDQLNHLRDGTPGYGSCSVTGLNRVRYYRVRAKKNIRFKAHVMANRGGQIGNGGLVNWGADDPLERLDVLETVAAQGVVIPTINTLQYEPKEGGGEPLRTHPAVQIIMDTSSSMPQETAILTCFSLIEAARLNNVEVSLVLYYTSCWLAEPFTSRYNQLEEKMINHYKSGGTHSHSGVREAKKILKNRAESALVIWVSDLEDYSEQLNPCFDDFDGFRERGHLVSLLHLDASKWRRGWGAMGFLEGVNRRRAVYLAAEVNRLSDLDGLVIDQLNSYVN